jgi:hypothetical protein
MVFYGLCRSGGDLAVYAPFMEGVVDLDLLIEMRKFVQALASLIRAINKMK